MNTKLKFVQNGKLGYMWLFMIGRIDDGKFICTRSFATYTKPTERERRLFKRYSK